MIYEFVCTEPECENKGKSNEFVGSHKDVDFLKVCAYCGKEMEQDFTNKGVAIDTSKIRGFHNGR